MLKSLLKILAALTLFAAAPLVFAGGSLDPQSGNAWDLYVFGNGEVIFNILMGIKAIVSGSGFSSLMMLMGVIGIISVALTSGYGGDMKFEKVLVYVVAFFAITYGSTRITSNVMINDPVGNYANVATDVPAIVAVPVSAISSIGDWMTREFETVFSMPNNLTVSQGGGFNLATSLVNDATQIRINDPNLRGSVVQYVSNCVMPMLVSGELNNRAILQSTNLWNTLKSDNAALVTPVYSSANDAGALTACSDAHGLIEEALEAAAPGMLQESASAWYSSGAFNWLSGGIQSAFTWLSDGAMNGSAASHVQQAAVINLYNDSYSAAAAQTGNNELITSLALEQAKQTQKTSWMTTAELFKDVAGYLYAVLQAFVFALAPVVLIALLVPGWGKAIIKNYGQIIVWLILWMPMMAVINYIIALFAQQDLSAMLTHTGGLTVNNLGVVTEKSSKFVAVASFLAAAVPVITWGLVKGGIAFTSFLTGATGSSIAAAAANNAASGNISMDSQSMGNQSFGQKNLMPKTSVGFGQTMANSGGAQAFLNHDLGGASVTRNNQAIKHEGSRGIQMSESEKASQMQATTKEIANTTTALSQANASYGKEIAEALNEKFGSSAAFQNMDSEKRSQMLEDAKKAGLTYKEGSGWSANENVSTTDTGSTQFSAKGTAYADAHAGAKIGVFGLEGGVKGGVKGEVSTGYTGASTDKVEQGQGNTQTSGQDQSASRDTSVRGSTGAENVSTMAVSAQKQNEKLDAFAEKYGLTGSDSVSKAASEADKYQEQLSQSQEYLKQLNEGWKYSFQGNDNRDLGTIREDHLADEDIYSDKRLAGGVELNNPLPNAGRDIGDSKASLEETNQELTGKVKETLGDTNELIDLKGEGFKPGEELSENRFNNLANDHFKRERSTQADYKEAGGDVEETMSAMGSNHDKNQGGTNQAIDEENGWFGGVENTGLKGLPSQPEQPAQPEPATNGDAPNYQNVEGYGMSGLPGMPGADNPGGAVSMQGQTEQLPQQAPVSPEDMQKLQYAERLSVPDLPGIPGQQDQPALTASAASQAYDNLVNGFK